MSSDTTWAEGLTEEQKAMVEKATQTWHESRPHSHPWLGICEGTRNSWCVPQLAALRAIGVIPPPAKVKTRGEELAEKYVDLRASRLRTARRLREMRERVEEAEEWVRRDAEECPVATPRMVFECWN